MSALPEYFRHVSLDQALESVSFRAIADFAESLTTNGA
jgi:hypothetical protein